MSPSSLSSSTEVRTGQRHLWIFMFFFASGCSALIYEVVWFQLLQLTIGSTTISLGILLGTFMGGLCIGSLAFPRLVSPEYHPIRAYALLEFGIGLLAVAVLFGIPYINQLYVTYAGDGFTGILFRGAISGALLLPPTILMGATLPAIARWVKSTPQGVSWLGVFYAANLAGAVFGCLLAGFYLLRVYDMALATYLAVAINGVIGLAALWIAAGAPYRSEQDVSAATKGRASAPRVGAIYIVTGLSGLTALGAQVIWTRVLSLVMGATVYTFSIILAVFLLGLGIGSVVGASLARTVRSPRLALGICQMLLAAGMAWTALMIGLSLPYWPVSPSMATNPWIIFQLDLARTMWAVLPPALFWGASFPLALAAAAAPGQDPGSMVGRVYAANTVGAIVGALIFAIVMIPWIGTQMSQQILIGLAVLSGLVVLVPYVLSARDRVAAAPASGWLRGAGTAALAASLIVAVTLAYYVPPIPGALVAYGRYMSGYDEEPNVLYLGEGVNASVAVVETAFGTRTFHVSGKTEASTNLSDMRLQRLLGHTSGLLHPNPRSVLIVGFGAGVTAGSLSLYPGVERIVICEIEPLIPGVVANYFGKENYDVLKDPRVEVVYDDARHYLLRSKEKFDVITSDPIHPWVKGSATLYTREYFELVRQHLNPGGVITQWVPLYESTPEVVKSQMATFFESFPKGIVWANEEDGGGYDVVLFAQETPAPIDVDAIEQRLQRPDYTRIAESLREVEINSVVDLLGTFAGRDPDLKPWLNDALINTDLNLRLQYLAGLGLNHYEEGSIYEEMLTYRRYPDDWFIASEATSKALRDLVERERPTASMLPPWVEPSQLRKSPAGRGVRQ